ncbi:hypothetical protein D3C84_871730 [compost metagenome]
MLDNTRCNPLNHASQTATLLQGAIRIGKQNCQLRIVRALTASKCYSQGVNLGLVLLCYRQGKGIAIAYTVTSTIMATTDCPSDDGQEDEQQQQAADPHGCTAHRVRMATGIVAHVVTLIAQFHIRSPVFS